MTKPTLRSGERIDQLYSQDIQIIQSPEVFAFSLDAVLLAAFAKLPPGPTAKRLTCVPVTARSACS